MTPASRFQYVLCEIDFSGCYVAVNGCRQGEVMKTWHSEYMRLIVTHMSREIKLASETETRALGARLAHCLKPGDVVALQGGLGAGKTSLARGLVQALLGAETEVPSPTYTFVQVYEVDSYLLWHFDLYRLETPDSIFELGWDDTPDGVALIEWPDKAGRHLPAYRLDISLEVDGSGRIARLEPHGEYWQSKLNDF